MYLKDGNILYSQKVTDSSSESVETSHVYKKELPDGRDEEICPGEIQGFSPDGEHFVVYSYTLDPYRMHYFIYETGDIDAETAHYEPADGATFLAMDKDNAYFLEKKTDNVHTIVQVSNKGNIYRLGECDFSELAEYGISNPEFSGNVSTENGLSEHTMKKYIPEVRKLRSRNQTCIIWQSFRMSFIMNILRMIIVWRISLSGTLMNFLIIFTPGYHRIVCR